MPTTSPCACASKAACCACEVLDRGHGMSEAVLSNALVPFYSTKRSGTDVGLALAREIAEAHAAGSASAIAGRRPWPRHGAAGMRPSGAGTLGRWRPALLILLALLLGAPLLSHRDTHHPLAGTQRTDLCPLLPPPPASLHYRAGASDRSRPGERACNYVDGMTSWCLRCPCRARRQLSQGGAATPKSIFET